jgi:hypothetical protein
MRRDDAIYARLARHDTCVVRYRRGGHALFLKEDAMMLPLKAGLFAAATSALLLVAPSAPASAAPLGIAPTSLVRAGAPIEQARYRRHVVHRRHYVRHRYYRRYGYNPGLAMFGTVLGAIGAAAASDYYYPGYYAYPAYGYGYPAYGYGWGGPVGVGYWGW